MTPKPPNSVPVADIVIGERGRKSVGNVLALAASIKRLGLLHPIVVNTRFELIAGARRLAAVKKLFWKEVPCRIVATLDDATAALQAERDENTCREPLEYEDLEELGRRLEALEKPKAKARQAKAGPATGKGAKPTGGGKLPQPVEAGKTRDKVAAALGISGRTYQKLQTVQRAAAADPERYGDLPLLAKERSIDAADKELKRRREALATGSGDVVKSESAPARGSDRTQAVADALAALAAWQRQYEHLSELADVFTAINSALPSVTPRKAA